MQFHNLPFLLPDNMLDVFLYCEEDTVVLQKTYNTQTPTNAQGHEVPVA